MINLKRLKELDEKATGGPWEWDGDDLVSPDDDILFALADPYGNAGLHMKGNDRELATKSRNALPELIDWIERARPLIEAISTAKVGHVGFKARYPVDFDGDEFEEAAKLLGELARAGEN